MKKNVGRLFFIIYIITLCVFTGCASVQNDVVMSTDSFIESDDVSLLAARFIDFDASNVLNNDVLNNLSVYQDIDTLNKDIEECIKSTGINEPILPRLYALEGLVFLMQGNTSKANMFYNKSLAAGKGDSYTVILGYRLGIIKSITDENIVSGANENALLDLEQGLRYYKNGEYSKCVALLDAAFIKLPEEYKTAYSEIRQKAWDLRNNADVTGDKAIIQLLNKSQITVGQMVLITQGTSDVLYLVNGGKNYSEQELFTRLVSAGYFEPCSVFSDQPKAVKKTDIVDRKLCARFLWNVYCNKKNLKDQNSKYSLLYRSSYGMSPIPDIDLFSSDFDAILGVVENEIMDLPDGQNFKPDKIISASEFNACLQKIK